MVKPAQGPEQASRSDQGESWIDDADEVTVLEHVTGDPKVSKDDVGSVKPSPFSGHSDDPSYYVDQEGKVRWRILGGQGEVIASATEGFDSEKEAKADFDKKKKDNGLLDLRELQGKSGSGFTTTSSLQSSGGSKGS